MKGNVIRLNIMHLNSVHLNSIGEVQSVSLTAGESTEDPVYPPTTYTLAANVSNGKVTATKNGTVISLPYVATEGDVIVLSVTPDEGYEFNGWLDGNKSNPRTVTMTGNVVLSASCVEIAKPTYTLSASVTNGMVSAKRNGSAVTLPFTANEGDTIVLSVTPNDGYAFEGWADGNTDNPRTITMNADVALSAECSEVVQPPVGNYIQFEDKAVEAICVANWSSDGIGLTEEDAAKVTTIGTTFKGNTEITSFDEFRYFTGVTFLGISTNQTNGGAFNGCTSLRSIKLPSSVTHLRPGAFNNCTSLRSVGDLSNVTRIDIYAFAGTPLEGEINLASAEGAIGYSSFTKTNITKIVSLGNATIIGGSSKSNTGAFAECGLLQSVELPSTLKEIQNWALYKCTSLEIVICRATTPPTLASANAFQNTNNCPIYVPDASLEAYRTATNWNQFADRIHPLSEIEGGIPQGYVKDAILSCFDGINKGGVANQWKDLSSQFIVENHGATELENGWGFDGNSWLEADGTGYGWMYSPSRTLEVVAESEPNTNIFAILAQKSDLFGLVVFPSQNLVIPAMKTTSCYENPFAKSSKVIITITNGKAYVNGEEIPNKGQNGANGEASKFYIGRRTAGHFFKGKIYAIRIHDRILTEEEILVNQRLDNERFNLGLDI